ncbi:hypothetical protein KDL29_03300 [bacterium]|nr:hypothetical protein [bacterium]
MLALLLATPSPHAHAGQMHELKLGESWRITKEATGEDVYNCTLIGNARLVWFGSESGMHIWDRHGRERLHLPDITLETTAGISRTTEPGLLFLMNDGELKWMDTDGQFTRSTIVPGFGEPRRFGNLIVNGNSIMVRDADEHIWLYDSSLADPVEYGLHQDAHDVDRPLLMRNGNLVYMLNRPTENENEEEIGIAITTPDGTKVIDPGSEHFPETVIYSVNFGIESIGDRLFLARTTYRPAGKPEYEKTTCWFLFDENGNLIREGESPSENSDQKLRFLRESLEELGETAPGLAMHLADYYFFNFQAANNDVQLSKIGLDPHSNPAWATTVTGELVYTCTPGNLRYSDTLTSGRILRWLRGLQDWENDYSGYQNIPVLRDYFDNLSHLCIQTDDDRSYIAKLPAYVYSPQLIDLDLDEGFAIVRINSSQDDYIIYGFDINGLPYVSPLHSIQ